MAAPLSTSVDDPDNLQQQTVSGSRDTPSPPVRTPTAPSPASTSGSSSTSSPPSSAPLPGSSLSPKGSKSSRRNPWRCFKLPHALLSPAAQSLFPPGDAIYFRYRELPPPPEVVDDTVQSVGPRSRDENNTGTITTRHTQEHHHPETPDPQPQPCREKGRMMIPAKTHPGHAHSLDCDICIQDHIVFSLFYSLGHLLTVAYFLVLFYTVSFGWEENAGMELLPVSCSYSYYYPNTPWLGRPGAVLEYLAWWMIYDELFFSCSLAGCFWWKVCVLIERETARWRADNGLLDPYRDDSLLSPSGGEIITGRQQLQGTVQLSDQAEGTNRYYHSHLRDYITWASYLAEPCHDPLHELKSYLRETLEYLIHHVRKFVEEVIYCLRDRNRRYEPHNIRSVSRPWRFLDEGYLIVRLKPSQTGLSGSMREALEAVWRDHKRIDCAWEEYVRLLGEGGLRLGSTSTGSGQEGEGVEVQEVDLRGEELFRGYRWEEDTYFVWVPCVDSVGSFDDDGDDFFDDMEIDRLAGEPGEKSEDDESEGTSESDSEGSSESDSEDGSDYYDDSDEEDSDDDFDDDSDNDSDDHSDDDSGDDAEDLEEGSEQEEEESGQSEESREYSENDSSKQSLRDDKERPSQVHETQKNTEDEVERDVTTNSSTAICPVDSLSRDQVAKEKEDVDTRLDSHEETYSEINYTGVEEYSSSDTESDHTSISSERAAGSSDSDSGFGTENEEHYYLSVSGLDNQQLARLDQQAGNPVEGRWKWFRL